MEDQTHIVQRIQYEMLCEVKRLCDLYHIPYFLCCGTLLGCIRHRGPIPWDDDLDVGFLRKDYKKFLEIAYKEIDSEMTVQTWHSDLHYALPHGKIRYNGTHYIETVSKESGCHDGISIDILPFDTMPNNKIFQRIHGHYLWHILNVIKVQRKWKFNEKDNVNHIWNKIYKALSKIRDDSYYIKKYEEVSQKYNDRTDMRYVSETAGLDIFRFIERKERFETLSEAFYIEQYFKIPSAYKAVLKNSYGNYMSYPPVEEQKGQPGVESVILENKSWERSKDV